MFYAIITGVPRERLVSNVQGSYRAVARDVQHRYSYVQSRHKLPEPMAAVPPCVLLGNHVGE